MSEIVESLTVKINADLSEFDKKIDAMQGRLESIKKEVSNLFSQITALSSYTDQVKIKVSSTTFAEKTGSRDNTEKVLSEIETKLKKQAAMISR